MGQLLGFLQTIGYLALAVLLLMFMITIHEFGHYITAKIMHFKIYEFSIGMGKQLFKKTKPNGEVFSIRLIPVGGYCSFGEDDKPDNDPDSFNNKAPWQRLIVLFSGAFFNFLSAIIFAVIVLSIVGYGRVVNLGAPLTNSAYENDASQPEKLTLSAIINAGANTFDSNGAIFNLSDDMLIESINGKKFHIMRGVPNVLDAASSDDNVVLVVYLADEVTKQTVTIKNINRDQWAALRSVGDAVDENGEYVGYYVPPHDNIYHNVGGAILKAVPFSFEVSGLIFDILGKLVTGQLGMKAVGGTVATVSVMSSNIGQSFSLSADMTIANIFYLLTLISINLAVFNWLPIPSLDGARMVFVLIEWIRGKPINRELEAKIHMIGIICLMGFVIFADAFWIFNNLSVRLLL